MILDPEIKLAGIACQLVRSPSNLDTVIYHGSVGKLSSNSRGDPEGVFDVGYYLPTDCAAVLGDLIIIDSVYYLLMSFEKLYDNGVHSCYKGKLYRCNATISIYSYNRTTKKHSTLRIAGVRCLLTQANASEINSDKTYVIDEYRGKNMPYRAYMQASAGLIKNDVVKDQSARMYRVLNDFDPYIANGVTQTQLSLEG